MNELTCHSSMLRGASFPIHNGRCQTDATTRRGMTMFEEASENCRPNFSQNWQALQPRNQRTHALLVALILKRYRTIHVWTYYTTIVCCSGCLPASRSSLFVYGSAHDIVFKQLTSHSTVHSTKNGPKRRIWGGGVLTHTNGPCLLPSYDALNLTPTLHTILKFEAHTRTWPSTPEEINLLNKIAFDIKWQNPENKKVRYLSIVLRVLMLWNHIMLHTKIVITWHKWFQ